MVSLARSDHPHFGTRGAPGTHDVALALDVLSALAPGEPASLPRFDKARDDRADPALWGMAPADTRVLILEGWFVGARPETGTPDPAPLNDVEVDDAHGPVARADRTSAARGISGLIRSHRRAGLSGRAGFRRRPGMANRARTWSSRQ
jgi:D-glycerate 3-kinase